VFRAGERQPALSACDSFDLVASRIADSHEVLCCHKSQIWGSDYKRPVYTIRIPESLFDQFFNASYGYRAAFYRSPGSGMDANQAFLRAMAPKLMQASGAERADMTPELIEQSLATPSAKAWLAEAGKEPERDCPACKGEWSTANCGPADLAEVRNGRWELARNLKAEWGRKAPYLTKLRIMGAFLDDRYNELVPHDKRSRAQEIHAFGWS
jgi:hypothetical protein